MTTLDTKALRAMVPIAEAIEDPPSAAQQRARNALAAAAPALLDAAEERDKYRTAASVLCGAHIGLPQASCPVCERDALKAEIAWRQEAHDTLLKTASEIQAERNALKAENATLGRFMVDKDALNQHLLGQVGALKAEVERLREALRGLVSEIRIDPTMDSSIRVRGFRSGAADALRSAFKILHTDAALRPASEGEVKP